MSWDTFIASTKHKPPHELLVRARQLVSAGRALDLGAGGLRDTRYLASEGFSVTAVDADTSFLNSPHESDVTLVNGRVEDFNLKPRSYILINAQYVLPFVSGLPEVVGRIHDALVPGGVFTGQLFGANDSWNDGTKEHVMFHTTEQAHELLSGFDIVHFEEREWDGKTALGVPKHWHIYEFILRRAG